MRLRRKKNHDVRLERCEHLLIHMPEIYKNNRKAMFGNENPLMLEIGSGKGKFIIETARGNPQYNFIAMETVDSVMLSALEKVLDHKIDNLRFMLNNAENLTDYFAENELSRIYLNFSDPHPKTRNSKKRLTHKNFLDMYKYILKDKGEIHQKTDNLDFFNFSVKSFTSENFCLRNVTYDLYETTPPGEVPAGNVPTEYEERFVSMGSPICRLEAILHK